MKKYFLSLMALLVFSLYLPFVPDAHAALYTSGSALLKLNNGYILYSYEQMPYIDSNGRMLVPLRMIGDLMEAKVNWDATTQQAVLISKNTTITAKVGSNEATVNGKPLMLNSQCAFNNNTFMVPIRLISQGLNITLQWDDKYHVVTLKDDRFFSSGLLLEKDRHMENLDTAFTGKLIPTKISFVKSKNVEDNKFVINILNASNSTIKIGQLNKNTIWYRGPGPNDGAGPASFGMTPPGGDPTISHYPGDNDAAIPAGGYFSAIIPWFPTLEKDSHGMIKYAICNFFKTK